MNPTVSIIIVNYNTPELVYDALDSLRTHLKVSNEILIVENSDTKPVNEERIGRYNTARVIRPGKNLGFGGGNNLGAREAKGNYLWLLNSDTLLVDDSVNAMFSYMDQHPEVGALSPLLYNDRDLTVFQTDSYAYFQSLRSIVLRKPRPALRTDTEFFPVDMVVAASVVIPRSIFEEIGGFDERIFMFFEDDDICYRIHRAGKRIGILTSAHIVHLQGKSIKRNADRKRMYYRSQDYFWKKHYGRIAFILMKALRIPYALLVARR